MTLKPGNRGFLQLGENFAEPRWREALVVGIQESWLQCLVRCSKSEADSAGLSCVETGEATFVLVEAPFQHLLSGVAGSSMNLDTDLSDLLKLGLSTVHSEEELVYATASEPTVPKRTMLKGKKKKVASSSSEESAVSEEENIASLLRETWLGGGTGEDKRKKASAVDLHTRRKSKRFAMIERKKDSRARASNSQLAEEAVLQAAAGSGNPLHGLLALQLAQSLKNDKKGKGGRKPKARSSRSSGSSSESSSDQGDKTLRGHSRAVHNYQKSKKKMFQDPVRHVRRFVRGMEDELGAKDRPFRVVDYNRRIHWGKQRNLQRCHYLVSVVMEELLREEPERAALRCALTLQALHQAALDGGDWQIAWLLTHVEDPFEKRLFGGTPESLQHVTGYLRSMGELAKATENLRRKGFTKGDREDAEKEKDGKGKRKGASKKEKDKPQSET